MPKRILAGMFLSLLFNSAAFAGWTSGGGEILKDAQNPWFITKNTSIVKYCIEMDEKNFGATREQTKKSIEIALAFWKKQFTNTGPAMAAGGYQFVMAQHQYVEVACNAMTDLTKDQNADIKFQFGTLNGEQFAYFKDPTKQVAAAVRTVYDTKQLKGKGFIYVSPENGPFKIQAKGILAQPWSKEDGVLLVPVLIHELGHVFGIPHNPDIFIMKEDFPETLLTDKPYYLEHETWSNLISSGMIDDLQLFKFTGTTYLSSMMGCADFDGTTVISRKDGKIKRQVSRRYKDISQKFFGFSFQDYNCYGYQMKDYEFQLLGYKNQSTNAAIPLGTAIIDPTAVIAPILTGGNHDLVNIYFPEDQALFNQSGVDLSGKKFAVVTYSAATKLKGEFVSADGKTKRKVLIEVGPYGQITVGGVMDGEVYYDVMTGY